MSTREIAFIHHSEMEDVLIAQQGGGEMDRFTC
jgi:hypothetical protein